MGSYVTIKRKAKKKEGLIDKKKAKEKRESLTREVAEAHLMPITPQKGVILPKKIIKDKRINAHTFIKNLFKDVNWEGANLTEDEDIADLFAINLPDITMLKEGRINPTSKLVEKIKYFFGDSSDPRVAEQIERNLVDPFTAQ